MLRYEEAAIRGLDMVASSDFFRDAHRRIFESMARIHSDGTAVDFVTICHDLKARDELDEVGGPAYVSSLADGVPRTTNIAHYAEIVKETKRKRDLVYYGNKVLTSAYAGAMDSRTLVGEADRWLGELSGAASQTDLLDQSAAVGEFLDSLDRRIENKHELLGRTTGFPSLDDLTCGLVPEELTILGAGTGMGKTGFAVNIAMTTASQKGVVMFVSLEMSRQQLLYRVASAKASVELIKIRKGLLTDRERERVTLAMTETAAWPLYVDDAAPLTVRDIRARCRRLAASQKIALVVVDYIQLVTGDTTRKGENRTIEVGEISRGLKLLARELHVPILALAQITRESGKQKRRPQLHDLRESGGLEQNADNVWFLYEGEKTELIIAKQRQGPVGTVEMFFDKAVCVFHDSAADAKAEDAIRNSQTALPDW